MGNSTRVVLLAAPSFVFYTPQTLSDQQPMNVSSIFINHMDIIK
jgi:hypothetical protein